MDAGLRIAAYDEAKVTILTEGNNAGHLKRWVQLNFSNDVHVFAELAQHRSASQLLAYGRLLWKDEHEHALCYRVDCDAADEAEILRRELSSAAKVMPFSFRRRQDNMIARNGIENNYDEKFLRPFSISKVDNDGNLLGREFPKNRKTEFANHVLERGTSEYLSFPRPSRRR